MIVEMLDIISDFNVIGGDGEVEDVCFGKVEELRLFRRMRVRRRHNEAVEELGS